MLNVKKLLIKMLQKIKTLDDRTYIAPIPAIETFTTVNCTGTPSGFLHFHQSKNGQCTVIYGRININNFVRTGSNPGVTFTLPSEWKVLSSTLYATVGFPAQYPREYLTLDVAAGTRNAKLYTTESFNNMANGAITFTIPAANIYFDMD